MITTVPKMNKGGCIPYIEVLNGRDLEMIWTNKNSTSLKNYKKVGGTSNNLQKITINID